MKTGKYLNPINLFLRISVLVFKIRMRSFYSPFRQGCYRNNGDFSSGPI